ncbi:MAG: PKD domain-containing protein [Planctomycetota bacterium]|nr:PKD domain-containing protein [Planctomycetota bacterium]
MRCFLYSLFFVLLIVGCSSKSKSSGGGGGGSSSGGDPEITVAFSATPTSGSSPLTVNFTDSSTSTAGTINSWQWDVDNNGVVDYTTKNPSHQYASAGTYSVKLTVGDNAGNSAWLLRTSYIVVTTAPVTVEPPLGGSSGGSGGSYPLSGSTVNANGITCRLIVPNSYSPSTKNPLMIVYSGTEGGAQMTNNLLSLRSYVSGISGYIFAVLDGVTYNGNGAAGATVLDWVRSKYNIDNDRTYLLSESAGTSAGLKLGFDLRQSYFAAYWANDVNCSATPKKTATQLGFAPWGNAGPGGDYYDANIIVNGMKNAGYRLPADAPYSGPGSGTHGSPDQFIAALQFFPGKSRQ